MKIFPRDLRFNAIEEIWADDFYSMKSLDTLLLNDNQLRRLPASVFSSSPNLRYLFLYNNQIDSIEPGAFDGLRRLEQLYLHGNQLRTIQPGTFAELPRLKRLYLQNNKLERLPADAFKSIGPATRLRLDSNALVCDCEIVWLVEKMRNRMESDVVCQGPQEMKGRRLDDMTPDDFHCSQPVIMEGPEDLEVQLGQTAVFRCRVTGEPHPSITWMRDSNEVPMDDDRYYVQSDGTLVINDVTEDDAGHYECVAHNDMGFTRSRSARTLVVTSPVPHFLEVPQSQTVRKLAFMHRR